MQIQTLLQIVLYFVCLFIVLAHIIYGLSFRYSHPFWSRQPITRQLWVGLSSLQFLGRKHHGPLISKIPFEGLYYDPGILTYDLSKQSSLNHDRDLLGSPPISGESVRVPSNLEQKQARDNQTVSRTFLEAVNFVRDNYFPGNQQNHFSPEDAHLAAYFRGHELPCFLSVNKKTNHSTIQDEKDIISSMITSRPLSLSFGNTSIHLWYVDFLCATPEIRGKNMTPTLIYTHAAHQAVGAKEQLVSLFKREYDNIGDASLSRFVRPFVCFKTRCYAVTPLVTAPRDLKDARQVRVRRASPKLFFEALTKSTFPIKLLPCYSHFDALVAAGTLLIYFAQIDDHIGAGFVFRPTGVLFQESYVLNLVTSWVEPKHCSTLLYEYALLTSLELALRDTRNHHWLLVEGLATNIHLALPFFDRVYHDNHADRTDGHGKNYPQQPHTSLSEFYLYNYSAPLSSPEHCLFIY